MTFLHLYMIAVVVDLLLFVLLAKLCREIVKPADILSALGFSLFPLVNFVVAIGLVIGCIWTIGSSKKVVLDFRNPKDIAQELAKRAHLDDPS